MKELLPVTFLRQWNLEGLEKSRLQEIRLRTGQPVTLTYDGKEVLLAGHPVTQKELKTILEWLCGYGVYAYQTEMAKGYITIKGGHRVGIGGQVVLDKTGQVTQMKYISSLLIRVSHQVVGAAEGVIGQLYEENALKSTLILSPPGCGKTTMLRDLVRLVSDGNAYGAGKNVSLIDEREELAHLYMGEPGNAVGKRTDILSGCDKAQAMEMCLRALAPQVVALDEIYGEKDLQAIIRLKGSGCAILATHHADDFLQFQKKEFGKAVLKENIFSRFIVLSKAEGKYLVKEVLRGKE